MVRALVSFFSLHADHEQNCSTSTGACHRPAQTNLFACAAAASALWGPWRLAKPVLKGQQIASGGDDSRNTGLEGPSSGKRLMGFGHPV